MIAVAYPKLERLRKFFFLTAAAALLMFSACERLASNLGIPVDLQRDDPRAKEAFRAMQKSRRTDLGFSEIGLQQNLKLELARPGSRDYDVMLHVYGNPSRTVSFRRIDGQLIWVGEQEIHQGPQWNRTVDGTFRETMTMTFPGHLRRNETNRVGILYSGEDQIAS